MKDVADHGVDKGRLGAGDEERAAEALEEEQHAGGRAQVCRVGHGLDGNHGDLERRTPTGAGDDLVSDPFPAGRVGAQSVQQTGADGGDGCAAEQQRLVVSGDADQGAAGDGGKGHGNDKGQVADAAHGRVGAVDGLEVDGDVVDGGEEAAGLDKGNQTHDPVGALGEQLWRHHGVFALEPLAEGPGADDEGEADQEADDNGRVPGVRNASVLHRQDEGDGGAHHQDDAERVHLADFLNERRLDRHGVARRLEEDEDDGCGDTSNRQVDVEAPSPGDVVGEGSSQQRSDDTGKAVRSTDDAGKGGTLLGRRGEGDDCVCAGAEASGSQTGNGAAGDEGFSVGGGAADDGAELEDEDGEDEGGLEREILVCLAP